MCGIFGVINFDGQPVDKQKVLSARDILAHRGPDDAGVYFAKCHSERSEESPSVALTHRRLSIIDLSPAAHQPMTTEDGRFTIVFNGEIYNYADIRNQVSGIRDLRSTSDTEVILKLFALEGPDCLNKLRGMFAFAIWDDKEKNFLLLETVLELNLFTICITIKSLFFLLS
jgi:asparagine synthase (glutamine-hydrolysing)